jgi:hypothetical protein
MGGPTVGFRRAATFASSLTIQSASRNQFAPRYKGREAASPASRVSAPPHNMQNHPPVHCLGPATQARLTHTPPLRHCSATREQNPNRCYPQLNAVSRSVTVLVECSRKRNDHPQSKSFLGRAPKTIIKRAKRPLKSWPLRSRCGLTAKLSRSAGFAEPTS